MFGTSGIRGTVGDTITAQVALDLGRALASEGATRVVVGRDTRASGEPLQAALAAGLREGGATVVTVGVAATPTVARAVSWYDADAGVSVTASHNPAGDNGFKFWTPSGRSFGAERRERIGDRVKAREFSLEPASEFGAKVHREDAVDRHVEALTDAADVDGTPTVVVDLGNGAGGVTVRALRALGCSVRTLHADEDGRFPGRPSEPTAETCEGLCRHVAATNADFGVAHDGDADRMMAVTDEGEFVSGDDLLALFGRANVREGEQVAAPVNTSLAVDDALDVVGGSLVRTRVGDGFVASAAADPDVAFGGEPSGAWVWPEETLCPDGPLAAVRLAALVARDGPLSRQLETLPSYPIRRTSVEVDDREAVMGAVRTRLTETYDEIDTRDGLRVATEDGWFLIRPSGTQPLVRLTAEARTRERTTELFTTGRGVVEDAVATVER